MSFHEVLEALHGAEGVSATFQFLKVLDLGVFHVASGGFRAFLGVSRMFQYVLESFSGLPERSTSFQRVSGAF